METYIEFKKSKTGKTTTKYLYLYSDSKDNGGINIDINPLSQSEYPSYLNFCRIIVLEETQQVIFDGKNYKLHGKDITYLNKCKVSEKNYKKYVEVFLADIEVIRPKIQNKMYELECKKSKLDVNKYILRYNQKKPFENYNYFHDSIESIKLFCKDFNIKFDCNYNKNSSYEDVAKITFDGSIEVEVKRNSLECVLNTIFEVYYKLYIIEQ